MSTTTPVLGLTLYDSTTDQAVLFSTFRAVWGGTATTSNFYKIDTAVGTIQTNITSLQNTRGAITVPATFISSNYYEATVTSITSYLTGMNILLKLDTSSAGTVTLKINALDTKSVMKVNSSGTIVNITAGELSEDRYYLFTFDGIQWVWVNAMSGDQIYVTGGANGNVVTVGSDLSLVGTTTPSALLSTTINGATGKTTPVDADGFGIVDSAASNALKKLTWANLKATFMTSLGALINSLTAKTTPVGADILVIGDSASSNATKNVSLSNLYKGLGTGTQDSTTFLRGDGTYATPAGGSSTIQTKYIITPSVSSNNLILALKYINGNDPSSTNKLTFRVGDTEYDLTSSMNFTKSAGTNWMNCGSAELATKNVQLFVYAIGETGASAGLKFGYSRIPYAKTMGDFVNTSTNEKYIAGNWTNFNSTDYVTNIGRFQCQLGASSFYNWSIPSSEVVNFPIFTSSPLSFVPQFTNLSVGNGTLSAEYIIQNNQISFWVVLIFGSTTSISGAVSMTLPLSRRSYGTSTRHSNGLVRLSDTGTAAYAGLIAMDTTSANIVAQNAGGTYLTQAGLSSTVPFTWTTSDEILVDNVSYPI